MFVRHSGGFDTAIRMMCIGLNGIGTDGVFGATESRAPYREIQLEEGG